MNTQQVFVIPSPVGVKHWGRGYRKTNLKQAQVEVLGHFGVGTGSRSCLITNYPIHLREEISVFFLQGVRDHMAELKKKSTINSREFTFG